MTENVTYCDKHVSSQKCIFCSDARKFVLSCDECQRISNISRRQEMPMNYSLVIEPFDVWGFDYMGHFLPLMGIHIF